MGMMRGDEYRDSLRRLKPEIYYLAEKIASVADHPSFMILTTHYMEEASYLCDRIVIIDHGKVLARGTLDELLTEYSAGEIIEFSVGSVFSEADFPAKQHIRHSKFDPNTAKWRLVVEDLVEYLPQLQREFENRNIHLTSLECRKMTLDDLFVQMTGRRLDE